MNRGYDIAFSAGIVSLQPDGDCRVEAMLREADVLMYENKLDAKPRIEIAREA